ncbi:MAG: hypothetical protein GXY88_07915 [Tissierellia bacterium]|nr:hypothetical protein [Tissierellia bacterium]
MKGFYFRHRHKYKKIIGIALGAIGLLIIIKMASLELLLLVIGIVLIVMGYLIMNIK